VWISAVVVFADIYARSRFIPRAQAQARHNCKHFVKNILQEIRRGCNLNSKELYCTAKSVSKHRKSAGQIQVKFTSAEMNALLTPAHTLTRMQRVVNRNVFTQLKIHSKTGA